MLPPFPLPAVAAGAVVGLVLGLIGSGGSIIAVPMLLYVAGVGDPHVAIGTGAIAVAASAAMNLAAHHRAGNVNWRCAAIFALGGIAFAAGGATLGQAMHADNLLALFAMVMLAAAASVLRSGAVAGVSARCGARLAPRVIGFGSATGFVAGLFGIGGGFLVVPALIRATGMSMINAVGTSLAVVTTFGVMTALTYSGSGLVDWTLAGWFILGGVFGGMVGTAASARLSPNSVWLRGGYFVITVAVAIYILSQALGGGNFGSAT